MSFFYERTIPFNGIQQAIRVIHLRAADSLLEKSGTLAKIQSLVFMLIIRQFPPFFPAPLHNTHKRSDTKIKPNVSLPPPVIVTLTHIFSPGNTPYKYDDWGIKGLHIMVLIFRSGKTHLPFPHIEAQDRIYKSSYLSQLLQPYKTGENNDNCNCSAQVQGEHGLPGWIQHHLTALL